MDNKPLRVLIVEDLEDAALLVTLELRRGGYEPTSERVETAEDMKAALDKQTWDIVISDYKMPHFSGPAALDVLKESGLDLPFIIVSGAIGEETAVAAMRAGAHDYIMKDNLTRLCVAVERELREAEVRRQRRRAEEEITQAAQHWQETFDAIEDMVVILDTDFRIVRANRTAMQTLAGKEVIGAYCYALIHGTESRPLNCPSCDVFQTSKAVQVELCEQHMDGRWLSLSSYPIKDRDGTVRQLVHVIRDITDRKLADEALSYRGEIEGLIANISTNFISLPVDETDVGIDQALHTVGEFVGADRCYLFQFSDDGKTMDNTHEWCREGIESQAQRLKNIPLDALPWIVEKMKKCETIYIPAVEELPPEAEAEKKEFQSEGIQSMIGVPLSCGRLPGGFLGFDSVREKKTWIDKDIRLLKMVGEIFANSLERRRVGEELLQSFDKLQRVLKGTIQAMALVVESRDPYTAGHQQRVARLASTIAEEMGLSKDQVSGVQMAGEIHDIGKIHVPAEILSKPGRITEVEFSIIKTHPNVGYDILKTIEFPWPIAKIILQHHERMDGSGYPEGLKGDDTLIEARILAVADTVEAMASHRPYRPALGIDKALEEISQNKVLRYDPDVVDACIRLFTEKGFGFEQDSRKNQALAAKTAV